VLGPQEILMAEGRVLADGHLIGIEAKAGKECHIKVLDLDRPPEGTLQMLGQVMMYAVCPRQYRGGDLRSGYQRRENQRPPPPLA
jgi:hypothetical protein